ncbi:signal peptidase I [Psychrobacillus sp. FSL W7-1493]|uniref:signal peptidase I n=1 Tax=Psychrobacillus sp. FSL W7-1493 TaxID=2921552 RepID=UPI0030FC8E34
MRKLLVLLFFMTILAGCVSDNKKVYLNDGISMSPTLEHEQKLIIDKDYYIENDIKRDDIVLFKLEEKTPIKRVIGLPNEFIQISDGTIYIDNKPLVSEYDFVDVWAGDMPEEGIQLKSDEYFIIGDNPRPLTSKDSRAVGQIAKDDILGKVIEIK